MHFKLSQQSLKKNNSFNASFVSMNEEIGEKMLKEERYKHKFLGIIASLKQIIVSMNQLIWTLAASNSECAKVSYSAYGQTGSRQTITM